MERHSDNVQDTFGNAIDGVTVTIRLTSDASLASIFSDNIGTGKANPFTNDADGEFFFFAANNKYEVILTGPITETRSSVELFDPDDENIRASAVVVSTVGPTLVTPGTVVLVDVTSNAVGITLPLDLGSGTDFADIIVQHLAGAIGTNNVTVGRNLELIGGVAADLVMTEVNQAVRFIWGGSTLGWAVQAINNFPTFNADLTVASALMDLDNSAAATAADLRLRNSEGGLILRADADGFELWQTTLAAATEDRWLSGANNGALSAYYDNIVRLATLTNGAEIIGSLLDLDNSAAATAVDFSVRNSEGGALLRIDGDIATFYQTTSAGATEDRWFEGNNNADFAMFYNGTEVARTKTAATGGMEVNNTSTGAGFERVLTTADLTGGDGEILKVKTTDTVISDETLVDDTHLSGYSLAAATRYRIRGYLLWQHSTAGSGIEHIFTETQTGQEWNVTYNNQLEGGGTALQDPIEFDIGTTIVHNWVSAGLAVSTHLSGFYKTHATLAPTVDFQWAQEVGDSAGDATLLEGSWISFTPMT